ncbi:MAG: hypothetical protein ACTTIH_05540, partial [Porphyromonas gingivalis]
EELRTIVGLWTKDPVSNYCCPVNLEVVRVSEYLSLEFVGLKIEIRLLYQLVSTKSAVKRKWIGMVLYR